MLFDRPPPEPVIVTAYEPVGVDVLVVIVIVLVAVGELGLIVTELGLKLAEAPEGRPEAERLTAFEFTPLAYVTVTVAVMLPPANIEPLAGETDAVKAKKLAVTLLGADMATEAELLVPEASPVQQSNA